MNKFELYFEEKYMGVAKSLDCTLERNFTSEIINVILLRAAIVEPILPIYIIKSNAKKQNKRHEEHKFTIKMYEDGSLTKTWGNLYLAQTKYNGVAVGADNDFYYYDKLHFKSKRKLNLVELGDNETNVIAHPLAGGIVTHPVENGDSCPGTLTTCCDEEDTEINLKYKEADSGAIGLELEEE